VDKSLVLLKANLRRKKTGYPQLWSTVFAVELEGKASKAEDGLINSLKWNKVSGDAEHDDA
jgi:hypothetical protein